MEASSASPQSLSTRNTSVEGALTYSAKAPSISEPSVQQAGGGAKGERMTARTSTRSPIRAESTPSPTATMRPQQSAPWIRGKKIEAPVHAESAVDASEKPIAAPSSVAERTCFEYQPMRVFTSVLFTPAAETRIRTSPVAGVGTRTSSRYSSFSYPPCPVSCTARISVGRTPVTGRNVFERPLASALARG